MDEREVIYASPTQKYICPLCECNQDDHIIFWKCPIFKGELICQHCCQIETLYDDIDKKFSAKLGEEISLEKINEMCNACGNNCGKQNSALGDKLEEGKGVQHDFES